MVYFGNGFIVAAFVDFIVNFKYDAVFYLMHIAELGTLLNWQSVLRLKLSPALKLGLR